MKPNFVKMFLLRAINHPIVKQTVQIEEDYSKKENL